MGKAKRNQQITIEYVQRCYQSRHFQRNSKLPNGVYSENQQKKIYAALCLLDGVYVDDKWGLPVRVFLDEKTYPEVDRFCRFCLSKALDFDPPPQALLSRLAMSIRPVDKRQSRSFSDASIGIQFKLNESLGGRMSNNIRDYVISSKVNQYVNSGLKLSAAYAEVQLAIQNSIDSDINLISITAISDAHKRHRSRMDGDLSNSATGMRVF